MAGLSIHLFTDTEIAQVLESKCGIRRLLDFFQVEDLSYLTEKTGIPLERWKLVQKQILDHFGCTWKTASELETRHPSLASVSGQVESCMLQHVLEHIRSTVIVEVAGGSNCGKSELVYQIALFAILHMPVYLFTTSKRAACARLATLRHWRGPEALELYEKFYMDECRDFYTLCDSLQSLETCLEHIVETDMNSISCKALIIIDGIPLAQMLNLDCTYYERMSWIEFFTYLLKRIAFKYSCSVVVTNNIDRRGEPMFAPRWSYCPDVHILFQNDDSAKYQHQEVEMKHELTITSRWHTQQTCCISVPLEQDEINSDHL
ncbi:hypothetical protein GpartN1_g6174.t1 [Galdieria partita]|uniref:Uncharacterized protein n=1 Tax=Galdieria partita TaxID=83374 RepID=A0A9C7Q0R7_9RHOD|nr:hypothetical protein GpartN1_g6174.t1 [Galdieria partita]